ncbi:hypothetical protein [Amycolatopsis sp. SID8362]|uniref:hypothetical protein n=1 Tax=Amycolatopsis sp. SID8362 TaxID=2690346 RepID=UPI00136C4C16|nr:hypothetical protein [Amycolatopsis sp. SID8362]NBH12507.1 hypothetical protein [Amycolatopsis sp. SID8362]NED49199.1 hypothetical protein [Amycolatopsis sp. SID8362]
MTPLAVTTIEIIPRVLLLVVGLLGLIFAIRGRAQSGSGLMVAAFVIMLLTTVLGIAWRFVSLDAASWMHTNHLSADDLSLIFMAVAIPLDVAVVISWLLVALAVFKGGRPRPTAYPGFAGPGYAQPGYQQPPN